LPVKVKPWRTADPRGLWHGVGQALDQVSSAGSAGRQFFSSNPNFTNAAAVFPRAA
jgi:hypothetical protein